MGLLRRTRIGVAALLLAACGSSVLAATPDEYALKSVFLFNFCRFIDWPPNAFSGPADPLIIGIIGSDPFDTLLEEAVANESVRGRGIVIQHFRSPREVTRCHLLFVSESENARANEIIAAVAGRPIVTVGETEDFIARGGMIALISDRNRVRLVVNPSTLRAADLAASSKLLRVAEISR